MDEEVMEVDIVGLVMDACWVVVVIKFLLAIFKRMIGVITMMVGRRSVMVITTIAIDSTATSMTPHTNLIQTLDTTKKVGESEVEVWKVESSMNLRTHKKVILIFGVLESTMRCDCIPL